MVNPSTVNFMQMLGELTTGVNMFSLAIMALTAVFVGIQMLGGGGKTNNDPDDAPVKALGISLIPLGISLGYVAWFATNLVSSNKDLASIVGLAAFLRVVVFGI